MTAVPSPRQALDDIALCLVFFTRLPLPVFDFRGRSLADAIWAAPIAGLAVAVVGAVVYAIGVKLGLAAGPAAALVLRHKQQRHRTRWNHRCSTKLFLAKRLKTSNLHHRH